MKRPPFLRENGGDAPSEFYIETQRGVGWEVWTMKYARSFLAVALPL